MSYKNLAESALATANLDKALSELNPGIKFDKPEDRELLASLATMNKEGNYVVNLKKPDGTDETIELSKLSNEQQKEFLEQQKRAPKTLEEIAKAQLGTGESVLAEVKSIGAKITGGVVSSNQVRGISADVSEFARMAASTINEAFPKPEELKEGVQDSIRNITNIIAELSSGNISSEKAKKSIKNLEDQIDALGTAGGERAAKALQKIKAEGEKVINKSKGYLNPNTNTTSLVPESKKTESTKESKVDLGGTITIKVDGQSGMNKTDLERVLNSTEFKQKIYQYIKDIELEKEKAKRNSP
jgi:hypothetical protein